MNGNTYTYHYYIPVDNTGCGFYRMRVPSWTIMENNRKSKVKHLINEAFIIPRDPSAFQALSSFRIQRWTSFKAKEYFDALCLFRDKVGFKLIYDTDDVLQKKELPAYNSYPVSDEVDASSKYYMERADYVTTTTDVLKDTLVKLGINKDKIFVIPNYLPRWWGDNFDCKRSLINFETNVYRPRIGIVCGKTHFDINHLTENCVDDFYEISDWIIENRKKYQFVFMGGMNKKLFAYKDDFEIHESVGTLSFMKKRISLGINLYIQPLLDSTFNRAKSNIKLLEAYGEGVPIITQDLPVYSLNSKYNFNKASDLDKLVKNVLSDKSGYLDIITENYGKLQDYWIEDHISEWTKLMGID